MGTRRSYGGLDLFRMAAAVLVIAIHTSPLSSFSPEADFFLTRILARVAVPFFFMVTGQFVLPDILFSGKGSGRRLFRYLKKTGALYVLAICLYLPIGIYAGHYKELTVGGLLRMVFFDGTFYHLWYFPACLTGVALVYLLSRCMGMKEMTLAAGLLYGIGLFGDSYYGVIEKVPGIGAFYEGLFQICSYTRNGFFLAPIFLLLGVQLGGKEAPRGAGRTGPRAGKTTSQAQRAFAGEDPVRGKRAEIRAPGGRPALSGAGFDGLLLAFSFLAMTGEAFVLRHLGLQRHDSMYLALVPVMICLYRVLLSWNRKPARVLRLLGAWIYLLHPAMIVVVRGAARVLGLSPLLVENSLGHYLAVTALSVMAAFGVCLIRLRLSRRRYGCSRAWVELDREALSRNVDYLRSRLPGGCELMPAVKADAYGHGAALIAGELQRKGVGAFCVACAGEGVCLREQGIRGEILILGYTHPHEFPLLSRYGLTQTVVDADYGRELNRYAGQAGERIHVHIGVDTGMHRIGEPWENTDRIRALFGQEHLAVEGVFTHLCADDVLGEREREFTLGQARSFYRLTQALKGQGVCLPKVHLLSSYSVLNYPELGGDYARVGIALYGVLSTREDTEAWERSLKPVLSLKTRVAAVKQIEPGDSVGYGLAFTARRPMRIAALSIGYADGLPRSLSGGAGCALIGGKRAPFLGRICMDQTVVDVTSIPGVCPGDEAVLIGTCGEEKITAADVAAWAHTITNEILSRLGPRLERKMV